MKANEFVKEKGIDYAIKFLNRDLSIAEDKCELDFGEYENLKRLVESHELVALFDDIDCAKAWINDLCEDWPYQVKGSDNKFFKWQLEQAIADVESCQ